MKGKLIFIECQLYPGFTIRLDIVLFILMSALKKKKEKKKAYYSFPVSAEKARVQNSEAPCLSFRMRVKKGQEYYSFHFF